MDIYTYETTFIKAVIPLLKDYILSDEVFWNSGVSAASGQPPYLQLTLGNLMLAGERARAVAPDKASVQEIESQIHEIVGHWHTAWVGKAKKEYDARLRQWSHYLNDLTKDVNAHASYYVTEVRIRVLLQLLAKGIQNQHPDSPETLTALDALLWPHVVQGDFVWEPEVQNVFPDDEYWFLFGRPGSIVVGG